MWPSELLQSSPLLVLHLRWRSAFWLEALAMAPFALFCLLAPPIDMRGPMTGASWTCSTLFSVSLGACHAPLGEH